MPNGHLTYVDAFNPHNYLQLLALLLEEGIETKKVLEACLRSPHKSLGEALFFPRLKIPSLFAGVEAPGNTGVRWFYDFSQEAASYPVVPPSPSSGRLTRSTPVSLCACVSI